jgi:UDP-4-amino-4,6-dideoxy-N-acetyl-beta-L-altrosamine transaminase
MIPYGRQEVTDSDIDSVVEVLRSDFLTQGPMVPRFERAVAERVGAAHAVAVNSATSALHVACLALGLGPGDLLWTVPNTFVASANCGRYCGAGVDFVDIDPATWCMSVAALELKLTEARRSGRLPKVVVPVHFAGQPTDQEAIWKLGREYGFRIIEDASHAIGASRQGHLAGDCRWSDITVFSFHPVKIVTSAEGGMALTNDPALAERMIMLRSHGITRDADRLEAAPLDGSTAGGAPPGWYYEQQLLGFNYRMTDLLAALGLSQLARLGEYVQRRNSIAQRYDDALADLPLRLPTVRPENRSAWHLYVVRLAWPPSSRSHRQIYDELRAGGVGVNLHYFPVHLQPYYRRLGFRAGQFPEAEAHGREAITLPLYPGMTDDDQGLVIGSLRRALEG